jgi:hypothetical protein
MMINCLFSTLFGVWRVRKGAITVEEINSCPFMFSWFRVIFLTMGLLFSVARMIFESVHNDVMVIVIVFRAFGIILQLWEHLYVCKNYTRLVAKQEGSLYHCARCLFALATFAGLGVFSALAGINGRGTDAYEHMFWSLAMYMVLIGGLIWGMNQPGGLLKHKYVTYRNSLVVGSIPCILIVLCHLKSKDVINRLVITVIYLLFAGIFHHLYKREMHDVQEVATQRSRSNLLRETGRRWSVRMMGPTVRNAMLGDEKSATGGKGEDTGSGTSIGIGTGTGTGPSADHGNGKDINSNNPNDGKAPTTASATLALQPPSTTCPFSPINEDTNPDTNPPSATTTTTATPTTTIIRHANPHFTATHTSTTPAVNHPAHAHAYSQARSGNNDHGASVHEDQPFVDQMKRAPSGLSMTSLLFRLSSRFPSSSVILPTNRDSTEPDQSTSSQKDHLPSAVIETARGTAGRHTARDTEANVEIDPAHVYTALTDASRKRLLNSILVDKVLIITGQVCVWYVLQFIVELCIIAYYNVNYGGPPTICATFVISGSVDPLVVLQTLFDMMT